MKKIFLVLSLLSNILLLSAQNTDHIEGQILVSLSSNVEPSNLVRQFATWRGNPTKLAVNQYVSEAMNIWLLDFDPKAINENTLLMEIRKSREVKIAQFNHIVTDRKIPNDPQFTKQWQWKNTGQTGGTIGADIKAEQAWDITTGGLTPEGDTIVVAIIDSGIDHNHPDLKDNIWYNRQEIPNNQIDDDGNGYVDDYRGWNPQDKNDNTQTGSNTHGTVVSGMVGAKGNNGIGVTGVNWNVKIMMIKSNTSWMLGNSEVNVLASYAYILKMRKLYNQTKGKKGAFVVSSNASWGINEGKAADSPLWCNFYDTLGVHGILNCGATSNSKVNVDVVGDLPTTCPSDYLIAVQASNNKDANSFSGYGVKNIDLAAPGDAVFSTTANGAYISESGTSFSSPTVAGAIALMYAAPSKIMKTAKSSPVDAVILMRQALLGGVDVIPALETQNATKGRLNLFNAVQGIISLASDCAPPTKIAVNNISDKQATISFAKADSIKTVHLYYKLSSASVWTALLDVKSPYIINNLTKCADYNFYLEAICYSGNINKTVIQNFKTLGCCEAPVLTLLNAKETAVSFSWNKIFGAQKYEVRYRKTGTWLSAFSTVNSLSINGLDSCTAYEAQIRTICDTSASAITAYSASLKFKTTGCGACLDLTYCTPTASASFEWIKKVKFNTLNVSSTGSSTGYSLNSTRKTALNIGSNYDIELTPGYGFSPSDVHFMAWIDWNQDGDFNDDGEKVLDPNKTVKSIVFVGNIQVPWSAKAGATRLRIGMRAIINDPIQAYSPCDNSNLPNTFFGEFEDYCVTLATDFVPCGKITNLKSNATQGQIELKWDAITPSIGYDISNRIVGTAAWNQDASLTNSYVIKAVDCKTYEFQVRNICENDLGEFTAVQNQKAYCIIATKDALLFEHIKIYPNPFEQQLTLDFAITEPQIIHIELLNAMGQKIAEVADSQYNVGSHSVSIRSVVDLPKGVYFIKMNTPNGSVMSKVIK
jgi:serine protease